MLDWKALERFSAKIEGGEPFRDLGPCWLWTAAINGSGYGSFGVGGPRSRPRTMLAHRWAYLALVGPIPDGLTIDHLCRVRRCVNPDHMEPVTRRVNTLRGEAPHVIAHHSGMCLRGLHPLSGENARVKEEGGVQCRECQRQRNREWYARNAESERASARVRNAERRARQRAARGV